MTPVVHLELPRKKKKIETALMAYSGAWGKLIREKKQSRKFRDTVPLKCRGNISLGSEGTRGAAFVPLLLHTLCPYKT
jgi:hypothetical protein